MGNYIFSHAKPKLVNSISKLDSINLTSEAFSNFPHIREFGKVGFRGVSLKSLKLHYNDGIEICYIHKGRYNWQIEDKQYLLYPNDCFITLPWQKHGSPKGVMDLGTISWIIIKPKICLQGKDLSLGDWSHMSTSNQEVIGKILQKQDKQHFSNKTIGDLLENLHQELNKNHFGYVNVVNRILDELFIQVTRSMINDAMKTQSYDDIGVAELEEKLKNALFHKWTLQDMANILGISQTTLNLRIKRETGFSPSQYLMDLRLNAAKKMLCNSDKNITQIAFECGFCSSQHFSTTFKQKIGYRPKDYKLKVISSC